MSKIGTKWESIKQVLHRHKHHNQVAPRVFCTYVAHILHIIFCHYICHILINYEQKIVIDRYHIPTIINPLCQKLVQNGRVSSGYCIDINIITKLHCELFAHMLHIIFFHHICHTVNYSDQPMQHMCNICDEKNFCATYVPKARSATWS